MVILIMSKAKKSVDATTQTIIRVYPHLLDIDEVPKVSADRRLQTVLSVAPKDAQHFYSLLRYTPYSDIKENSVRIMDIPRRKKCQFHSVAESEELEQMAKEFTLADDDGVGYICSTIMKRELAAAKPAYADSETQTDVNVYPHVLENNVAARVCESREVQTGPGPSK